MHFNRPLVLIFFKVRPVRIQGMALHDLLTEPENNEQQLEKR